MGKKRKEHTIWERKEKNKNNRMNKQSEWESNEGERMSCIYEKMRGVTDEDTKSIIFFNRLNYCTQMSHTDDRIPTDLSKVHIITVSHLCW
jgi:hypothetical protein